MRTRFDQLAKGILGRLFGLLGQAQTQYEIPGEVQAADLWYQPGLQPAPEHAAVRAQLGLLGRMAHTPCLIEAFHATPTPDEIRDCLCKQLNLRRAMAREATRTRCALPAVPRLWILSAGRPEQIMHRLELTPMAGWPPGFWQAAALLRTYLVVLRDLPETRETLILRLLGAGRTFLRAVHEIHTLPPDSLESEMILPELIQFRVRFAKEPQEDNMSYADEMQAVQELYEQWRVQHWNEGRELGMQEGRLQTMRDDLIMLYQARFGALPPALMETIAAVSKVDTLRGWLVPFATRASEEITAMVLGGPGSMQQ